MLVAIAALAAAIAVAALAIRPPNDHARLLHRGSLVSGPAVGGCGTGIQVDTETGTLCTHGDDTQFEAASGQGSDPIDTMIAAAERASAGENLHADFPCRGDGTSGNRIQFVYAYRAGHEDRLRSVAGRLRNAIYGANAIVDASAAQRDHHRYLRALTNSHCVPKLSAVSLPATAESSFWHTITYLQTKYHLDAVDRKYVVFGDFTRFCGIGSIVDDDRPGIDNLNNRGPSYARVDLECWTAHVVAHEIFHMLGAVQLSAPHSDGTWHCTDTLDLMCYAAGGKAMVKRCYAAIDYDRVDCGKNDYFNPDPAPRSYLATHWNSANNSFLYGGGPAYVPPPTVATHVQAVMTTATAARVSWAKPFGTVAGYVVYRDGVRVYKGPARNWTDSQAVAGQTSYQVQAYSSGGRGAMSGAVRATLSKPGAPKSVAGAWLDSRTYQITWRTAAGVITGYRLYGVQASGLRSFALTTLSVGATSGLVTMSYHWDHYEVCAYNAAGETCVATT